MKNYMTPLIGILVGIFLIFWSITSDGTIASFIDVPSFIITFFGSMCAVVISFPLDDLKNVPKVIRQLALSPEDNRVELVQEFIELAKKARVNGILSIEQDIQEYDNELLVNSVQMVIDGKDGETIQDYLELKMDTIEEEYDIAPSFFNKWGEFAPAFGMIGTLIGLIIMLGELNDPSTIGSGMATALITTFYGSMLANVIFLPLASNIARLAAKKMTTNEIILEGTLALQEGQNPRDLEEKLKTYLNAEELALFAETSLEESLVLGRQEG